MYFYDSAINTDGPLLLMKSITINRYGWTQKLKSISGALIDIKWG